MQVHRPVLLKESLALWHGREGGFYVDATLGAGGHCEALLSLDPKARCLGVDRDGRALEIAADRLKSFGSRAILVKGDYVDLPGIMKDMQAPQADGMLFDLGVSSLQLDDAGRGFSFRRDGPLDMRMDITQGQTAADLIARLPEGRLARVLRVYGEEKMASRIARALKEAQAGGRLTGTLRCAEIIEGIVRRKPGSSIHPATKTFQALRIAVNGEIEKLEECLKETPSLLGPGGRAAFISFHSLEDRRVKESLRGWSKGCVCPPDFPKCVCGRVPEFKVLTRKAVRPSPEEVRENPRSRSARLRAAQKV